MKKYKSIGFWVGILGAVLVATGSQISDFTTWGLLWTKIYDVAMNPATLIGIAMAVYGVWNNPSKKGLN